MQYFQYILIFIFHLSQILGCTIGLAYDDNNKPVIWKNRDVPIICDTTVSVDCNNPKERTNRLYLRNNGSDHDILAISTGGSSARYLGMNDKGFAIVNSYVGIEDSERNESFDNDRSIDSNASLISQALLKCESVEYFQNEFLPSIGNEDGLLQEGEEISSNFAVLDAIGESAIFEVYINSIDRLSLIHI